MVSDYYHQSLPDLGIAIERNTPRVPQDGRYYVLKGDEVVARFPNLKRALDRFKALKEELGFQPKPVAEQSNATQEHLERMLDAASAYWSESHKFRGRGGRGGRGGV